MFADLWKEEIDIDLSGAIISLDELLTERKVLR